MHQSNQQNRIKIFEIAMIVNQSYCRSNNIFIELQMLLNQILKKFIEYLSEITQGGRLLGSSSKIGVVGQILVLPSKLVIIKFNDSMNPRLAVFLASIAKSEQKIQISREIMGRNMNFSPAWIISMLQESETVQQDCITIKQFSTLFEFTKASFTPSETALIFDYFDSENFGKISYQSFIAGLIPHKNVALSKAIMKRLAQNLQITSQLKYQMKRFFQEILSYQKILTTFEGSFDHPRQSLKNYSSISITQLKQFMNLYGKCLSESQLSLIYHNIQQGRIKAVKKNLINQMIKQMGKKLENMPHNPPPQFLSSTFRGGKDEIGRNRASPIQTINNHEGNRKQIKEDSIQIQCKQIKQIQFPHQTPLFQRKVDMNHIVNFPRSFIPKSDHLSLLSSVNASLDSQCAKYKYQNQKNISYLKNQLGKTRLC